MTEASLRKRMLRMMKKHPWLPQLQWITSTNPYIWNIHSKHSLEILRTHIQARIPTYVRMHSLVTRARLIGIEVQGWP